MSTSDLTKNTLIALGSGCIFSLGFEPFGIWPLTIVSVSGLFYVLTKVDRVRDAFLASLVYGIGTFGVGVSWIYVSIYEYGGASVPLAVFLVALFVLGLSFFVGLAGLLISIEMRAFAPGKSFRDVFVRCWIFISVWFFYEELIDSMFGGFPWLLTGSVLLDTPFNGVAPILGVHGLTLIVLMVATTVRYVIEERKVLVHLLVLLPAWASGGIEWTNRGEEYDVALVQADVPLTQKWNPDYLLTLARDSLELTRSVGDKDLVVWSEGALPTSIEEAGALMSWYLESSYANPLLIGLTDMQEVEDEQGVGTKYYNALALYDNIKIPQVYRKRKLVPFGEFVPFENVLRGTIGFFDLPMSSYSKGPRHQALLKLGDLSIGTLICYEVAFAELVRENLKNGRADLIVVISEDAWFGNSIGPHQHLQLARMRALEHGKYLLRATNSGITAVIAPDGKIVAELPQNERGILEAKIFGMTGQTPFAWSRNIFPYILMIVFAILKYRWFTKSTRRRAT